MLHSIVLLPLDLRLFEGEGGDGTAAATEAAAPVYNSPRGKKAGEFDNVVFGRQVTTNAVEPQSADAGKDSKAGVQTTSDTLEAKRKAFDELVHGEYRDVYAEATQRIINQRFKETDELRQRVEGYQGVIDTLTDRYGVKAGDMQALTKAINDDSAFWAEAAEEAGLSVEQYKEMQQLRRQNRELLDREQRAMTQQQRDNQLNRWYSEAEQVKAKYQGFDLNAEVKNPQFLSLLKAGVPMEHAWKVIHMDDMMQDAMTTTAQATEQRVVANVRARGARPKEAGNATSSPFVVKDDVSKLTKAERAEIARRVARGERISF